MKTEFVIVWITRSSFSSSDLSLYIGWKKWVAECIVEPSIQKLNVIVAHWKKNVFNDEKQGNKLS